MPFIVNTEHEVSSEVEQTYSEMCNEDAAERDQGLRLIKLLKPGRKEAELRAEIAAKVARALDINLDDHLATTRDLRIQRTKLFHETAQAEKRTPKWVCRRWTRIWIQSFVLGTLASGGQGQTGIQNISSPRDQATSTKPISMPV